MLMGGEFWNAGAQRWQQDLTLWLLDLSDPNLQWRSVKGNQDSGYFASSNRPDASCFISQLTPLPGQPRLAYLYQNDLVFIPVPRRQDLSSIRCVYKRWPDVHIG